MSQKEKRWIIILLIVLLIAIVVYIIANSVNKNEINSNVNENSNTKISANNTQSEENKTEEYVEVLDDGTKVNTSTKLKETKTVAGLTIGNINFVYRNGKSQVIADVINNTSSKTETMEVTITLFDKDGKQISKMNGLIGSLEPGKTTKLDMGTTADVSNAYDFTIVRK